MKPQPKPKEHGGKREGAGRKPDWLKTKCASLVDKHKLLEYLARVAAGEETEQRVVVVREGNSAHTEIEEVKCSPHDRMHAIEMLLERGYGKPVQGVEVGGKDGAPIAFDVVIKVAE